MDETSGPLDGLMLPNSKIEHYSLQYISKILWKDSNNFKVRLQWKQIDQNSDKLISSYVYNINITVKVNTY